MAYQQLNRPDQAREALAHAARPVEMKMGNLARGRPEEQWHDWLIAHQLVIEATRLVENK